MKPYYDDGTHKIYNCDCRHLLAEVDSFDLLLTDPAYGLGAARKSFGGNGVKRHMTGLVAGKAIPKRDYGDSEWDDKVCPQDLLDAWIAKSSQQIIWGGNYFSLPPAKCILVWDKLRGNTDYADGEIAWTNLDKSLRIFRYKWNGFLVDPTSTDIRIHPTQKPLALIKFCLSLTKGVKTVVDPFAGSFTTAVACKSFGISSISCELNEEYCEKGAQRLSQGILDFGEDTGTPDEEVPVLFD